MKMTTAEAVMTKPGELNMPTTTLATNSPYFRAYWYDEGLSYLPTSARLAHQARRLLEHSADGIDDSAPYFAWLWTNEPDHARKLQIELLLEEVIDETVEWTVELGRRGVFQSDFRTIIKQRFEDALKNKSMNLPDPRGKYPREEEAA
jgi:hypothetical protein